VPAEVRWAFLVGKLGKNNNGSRNRNNDGKNNDEYISRPTLEIKTLVSSSQAYVVAKKKLDTYLD
jgi:hypothetical protein